MQKVIVTSATKFEGAFEIIYGDAGMGDNAFPPLLKVDFGTATLKDGQKTTLMKCIPPRLAPGFEGFFPPELRFAYAAQEVTFDEFWKEYNLKLNKIRCEKLWGRLNKTERELAFSALAAYGRYLSRNSSWLAKMNPETYLVKKCWQNDYDKI